MNFGMMMSAYRSLAGKRRYLVMRIAAVDTKVILSPSTSATLSGISWISKDASIFFPASDCKGVNFNRAFGSLRMAKLTMLLQKLHTPSNNMTG